MLSQQQQADIWIRQYEVEDLAKSLIREFLIQHNFNETLACLQREDEKKIKKISKSTLIKMLSLNNIVFFNKQSLAPFKSLLEVLASYLKDKFVAKIKLTSSSKQINHKLTDKTAISNLAINSHSNGFYQRNNQDKSLNNTVNLAKPASNAKNKMNANSLNKNQKEFKRVRPTTSKPIRNVGNIYAELEKQEQRQKISRLEERRKEDEQVKIKKDLYQRQKAQKERIERQKQKEAERIQKEQEKRRQEQERLRKIEENKKQQQKIRKQEQQREQKRKKLKQEEQEKLKTLQKQMRLEAEEKKRADEQKQKQRKEEEKRQKEQEDRRRQEQEEQRKRIKDLQKQKLIQEAKQREKQQKQKQEEQMRQIQKEKELEERTKEQEEEKNKQRARDQQLLSKKQQKANFILSDPSQAPQTDSLQIKSRIGMKRFIKKPESQQTKVESQSNSNTPKNQQKQTDTEKTTQNSTTNGQSSIKQSILETQKEVPRKEQAKMVKMFGKKKKNTEVNQQNQAAKFKFDENFIDKPLRQELEQYTYEKIQFNKIVLKQQAKAEISYCTKVLPTTKKYPQKQISDEQSQKLKKAIFQSSPPILPKSWFQGFILSPFPTTNYGLQQIEGGPCGIIAAVQCYYLKHYLHLACLESQQQMNNDLIRENCLVAALADILLKCQSSNKVVLALPPKSFSGAKVDITSLSLVTIESPTFSKLYQMIHQYKTNFIGKANHGVTVLLFSIVMTKTVQKISQEIDIQENPLIGNHGHCTQELVNLFITGIASSNVFNGEKVLDNSLKLKGVQNKAEFGFLTIFQALKYIEVGTNLKNPTYPFWIICKQFHYHVVFANNYKISENNNSQKFDIVYFDGLYNCADRIVITLQKEKGDQFGFIEDNKGKQKDLPLIEQVLMTKWGKRKADWNGSIKIL